MTSNNVICYYETLEDVFTSDSEKLVDLWRESWSDNGWNPIVLSIDDAKSHPEWSNMQISNPGNPLYSNIPHEEHIERFNSKKALEYHMSCHNRLFAYCNYVSKNQTTLYADFDVINYRLTPEKIACIPDDTVIGYARCVVKLSEVGANDMINALKKQMTDPNPKLRHDLEVCETYCTTFTNGFLPHCVRHQYEDCKTKADFVHYHGGWELLTEKQRLGCDTRWEFLNKFRPYKNHETGLSQESIHPQR